MMRKVLSLSIIAALLLTLLCGCGSASKNEDTSTTTANTMEESTGPVDVTIYYGNKARDCFLTDPVTLDKLDPGLIVEQLIAHGVMPDDCYLLNCSLLDKENGKKTLVLNFCNEFKLHLREVGAQGEYIMMGSVVNTFIKAYDVENVFVLSKRDVIKTDNKFYEDYLTFYS